MNRKIYKLQLTVISGLHIGSGNDKVQIGGVDSEIIKDPISKLPYIPGSSLKGKIRCLLETEGKYSGEIDPKLNTYFGVNVPFKQKMDEENKKLKEQGEKEIDYQTPTRLIFRDLHLNESFKKDFEEGRKTTEFKTEIVIDRKKGTAKDGGLRTIERVPPTVKFEGEIIIRYKDDAELSDIETVLKEGLELLKKDYLGGSGSRGYGAVSYELKV